MMILLYILLIGIILLLISQFYIFHKLSQFIRIDKAPTADLEKAVIYHDEKVNEFEARISALERKLLPPVIPVKPIPEKPNTDWMKKYE